MASHSPSLHYTACLKQRFALLVTRWVSTLGFISFASCVLWLTGDPSQFYWYGDGTTLPSWSLR